jgi:hypothetical protein
MAGLTQMILIKVAAKKMQFFHQKRKGGNAITESISLVAFIKKDKGVIMRN